MSTAEVGEGSIDLRGVLKEAGVGALGEPQQLGVGHELAHRFADQACRREGISVAGDDQRRRVDLWQQVGSAMGLGGEGHRRDRRRVQLAQVIDIEVHVGDAGIGADEAGELAETVSGGVASEPGKTSGRQGKQRLRGSAEHMPHKPPKGSKSGV